MNSRSRVALLRQRAITSARRRPGVSGSLFNEPWHSEEAFHRMFWPSLLVRSSECFRRPHRSDTYAKAMLMAGMTPAFCAKQRGHSIGMFLRTYSRWLDGAQNDVEMARLENTILPLKSPQTGQAS